MAIAPTRIEVLVALVAGATSVADGVVTVVTRPAEVTAMEALSSAVTANPLGVFVMTIGPLLGVARWAIASSNRWLADRPVLAQPVRSAAELNRVEGNGPEARAAATWHRVVS